MTKNPLLEQILKKNTPAKPGQKDSGSTPPSGESYTVRAVGYAETIKRANDYHVVPATGKY